MGDVAGLTRGRTPMLTLDRRTLARRIETLPWVASASVHRDWPSTVVVRIAERQPLATIPVVNGVALVDADGRILGTATTAPPGLVAIDVPVRRRVPGASVEPTVQHTLGVVVVLPRRLAEVVRSVKVTGEAAAVTLDARPQQRGDGEPRRAERDRGQAARRAGGARCREAAPGVNPRRAGAEISDPEAAGLREVEISGSLTCSQGCGYSLDQHGSLT